ncbi:MAG: delta(1)-pyrroline-2-carboxylate reductase family protein [Pseudomonadota bacterium]
MTVLPNPLLDPLRTVARMPWKSLVDEIGLLLKDEAVQVPPRLVQALPGGGSLFVMPALDGRIAITKLITYTPANAACGLPAIQGDVVVFDLSTGQRHLLLDGPTITARRTAAVSAFAAHRLASNTHGPMLIIGAGVQGKAHMEVFADVLGVSEFWIASRRPESATRLMAHGEAMGLKTRLVLDANAALADCPLAVTCTPASGVVLDALPRADGFISAVGAFTPKMVELSPRLCKHFADRGHIFVDTVDAMHEAGDLLQAGLNVGSFATLADVVRRDMKKPAGPVLFKSCGWAGWDLAAARVACRSQP